MNIHKANSTYSSTKNYLLLSLLLNPSLISPLILLLLLYFPLSPLHLTLSVLLFLGLLGLPLPVHGSLTPCVLPGPAYVQLRGSGGNPGTHQTSLHINLSWRHSPLPSLAPREITITPKLKIQCLTRISCFLFSLLSSAFWPHHLSPPSLLMTLLRSSIRRL